MQKIRVAIADDHKLFCEGMRFQIEAEEDMEVVVVAYNGRQLLNYLEQVPVDIVLLDLNMPEMDGTEVTETLRDQGSHVKIVIVSMNSDKELILKLIEGGVNGYLLKESDPEDVKTCIRTLQHRDFFYEQRVSEILHEKYVANHNSKEFLKGLPIVFTEKELQVIRMICKELTSQEIGQSMNLSTRSIEGYRQKIMEKIGCKNLAGIIYYAVKNHLVD